MITREQARSRLMTGYIIAALGFFVGIKSDTIHPSLVMSAFISAYVFWSTSLGWSIVYAPMKDFFANMIVFDNIIGRLFFLYFLKKMVIMGVVLMAAIFAGNFGGAIVKQLAWSRIAYF